MNYLEKLDKKIDKHLILKYIYENIHFRSNDKLSSFLKDIKERNNYNYAQSELLNDLCNFIIDNTLENMAALDCVKIVVDR